MAFFKSRSKSSTSIEERAPESEETQSMDVLRQRARHRLIGATVLVLVAVIGFPLVFDTKPREVASDIRIEMPDRDTVRPSQAPSTPAVAAKPPVPDDVKLPASQAPEPAPKEEVVVEAPKAVEAKKAEAKAPEAKAPEAKPVADEASKPKSDAAPRFVVQVGAFTDEAKVKEVRAKLEKAGFKTYVHVAQSKDGKRTRVRVGPFDTKAEAEKTVKKIKALNITAAVLTL
jgi:DedD protein